MAATLSQPTYHQDPTEVAPDTYVIHEVQHALGQPISVFINSVVVDGDEPLLIDTGSLRNRQDWLDDTFNLVDPKRVKWVFISHETGVYWAVDSFATPVPGGDGAEQLAGDVSDLDDEFWTHGMTMFAFNALAPWLSLVDRERFSAEVGRLSDLPMSTIISAHSPAITGSNIGVVLEKTKALPAAESPPAPDQAVLDLILAATQGP